MHFRHFTKITLPSMLYVTTTIFDYVTFTGNVNNFNVIYLLSGGDPVTNLSSTAGKTDLLVTWLYKLTIDKQYYNIGAVIGIMTFIIHGNWCTFHHTVTVNPIKKKEDFNHGRKRNYNLQKEENDQQYDRTYCSCGVGNYLAFPNCMGNSDELPCGKRLLRINLLRAHLRLTCDIKLFSGYIHFKFPADVYERIVYCNLFLLFYQHFNGGSFLLFV